MVETIKYTDDEVAEFRARQQHKRKQAMERLGVTDDRIEPDPEPTPPEGLVHSASDLKVSAATAVLVKDVAAKIERQYPGFRWAIQPLETGQVMNIFCLDMHDEYGYTILYRDIQHDPDRKEACRAAGEILERFGYTFRKFDHGPLTFDQEAMAALPRDPMGRALFPDLSGTSEKNVSRQRRQRERMRKAHSEGKLQTVVLENGEVMARIVE